MSKRKECCICPAFVGFVSEKMSQTRGTKSTFRYEIMRWSATNFVSGVQSLLGGIKFHRTNASTLEDIRQLILEELDFQTVGSDRNLRKKINGVKDLQELWYLRGDIMAALAISEGEANAKQKMAYISNQFKGLLPKGLTSRPSPLGH